MKYDVIVGGAGPAGICAAIAAKRGGANVLLIENSGLLGGTNILSLVGPSSCLGKCSLLLRDKKEPMRSHRFFFAFNLNQSQIEQRHSLEQRPRMFRHATAFQRRRCTG